MIELKKYIENFGISNHKKSFFEKLFEFLISYITGYNHNKYWNRRQYVIDKKK